MSKNHALTIPGVLERAVRDFPHAEAVVDGPVRLTYSELEERVRAVTRAFVACGVERGDRIAVWAPNSLRWVVTALGALCAGAVLVPVNTRYKGDEARWLLARSGARMLFVEDGFLGNGYLAMLGAGQVTDGAAGAGAVNGGTSAGDGGGRTGTGTGAGTAERGATGERPVPGLPGIETVVTFDAKDRPGTTGWEEFLGRGGRVSAEEALARSASVTPQDVADILFTSGTTGRPKGAMCTHGQNVRTYEAWCGRTGRSGSSHAS